MANLPTDVRERRYAEIKRVLTETNASLQVCASILGMPPGKLSRILNSTLRSWWTPYKLKRKKENARSRKRRYRQRKSQLAQDMMNQQRAQEGLPPVYPWVNPEDYI